jgi:hypothetical protein
MLNLKYLLFESINYHWYSTGVAPLVVELTTSMQNVAEIIAVLVTGKNDPNLYIDARKMYL